MEFVKYIAPMVRFLARIHFVKSPQDLQSPVSKKKSPLQSCLQPVTASLLRPPSPG